MSLLARLVLHNYKVWKKMSWGHCPLQPPLIINFLHGVIVLVRGYLRVRFDLPSSINFGNICGFPKLGARNLY